MPTHPVNRPGRSCRSRRPRRAQPQAPAGRDVQLRGRSTLPAGLAGSTVTPPRWIKSPPTGTGRPIAKQRLPPHARSTSVCRTATSCGTRARNSSSPNTPSCAESWRPLSSAPPPPTAKPRPIARCWFARGAVPSAGHLSLSRLPHCDSDGRSSEQRLSPAGVRHPALHPRPAPRGGKEARAGAGAQGAPGAESTASVPPTAAMRSRMFAIRSSSSSSS